MKHNHNQSDPFVTWLQTLDFLLCLKRLPTIHSRTAVVSQSFKPDFLFLDSIGIVAYISRRVVVRAMTIVSMGGSTQAADV